MTSRTKTEMMQALRLTRKGQIGDAAALLRRLLAGGSPAGNQPAQASDAPAVRDAAGAGSAWPMGAGPGGFADALPGSLGGKGSPALPADFKAFLDRIGTPHSIPGLDPGIGRPGPRPTVRVPEGARYEERLFTGAGGSRAYKLYVPSGYRGEPVPLVVMLHGCKQAPDDFAVGTRMNEVAEAETFLVAYPAQTAAANASRCWNWFEAEHQGRDRGEPSLVAGLTREIMQTFAVDPSRVYVAGLSAGGAAAAVLGAAYPDLFAAVGVHSGLACGAARDVPSAFAVMRQGGAPSRNPAIREPRPTIVFHGDRDGTVHPVNGEEVVAQSQAGAALASESRQGQSAGGIGYTRTVRTDAKGRPVVEHWVLHGAGHAWSGGDAAGSYTEPRGPDASREMARFFLSQANPAAGAS